MLHIHIICVGKLKENYWREAAAEYRKRLKPWASVELHELKEEPFDAKSNRAVIIEREASKITAALAKIMPAYVIALDSGGKQFSSEQLAGELAEIAARESGRFVFIIGGPLGLPESVKKMARLTWSLSPLTFTHQLARVVLLEQLYRAMMISSNRPYHY